LQVNEVEPCLLILFTAQNGPNVFSTDNLDNFLNLKPEQKNFFKEAFRWDQKLHVIGFQGEMEHLKKLVSRQRGQYFNYQDKTSQYKGFEGLKLFVSNLATQADPLMLVDYGLKGSTEVLGSFHLLFHPFGQQRQGSGGIKLSSHRSNSET
jgi:hypothetical protein